jgi:hypothetical protein
MSDVALTQFEIAEILGTRAELQDPENLDDSKSVPNPIGDWFARAELGQLNKRVIGVADFSWDEQMTTAPQGKAIEKRAKKKAVRSELFVDEIDGLTYRRHYDAGGELLATCQVYDLGED